MKRERSKRKLSHILAALCYAMALVSLLSSLGVTLAKYVKKDSSVGMAVAAPFYFSSDKLGEETRRHTISEPAAGQPVVLEFTLANFIDEFRCTSQRVEYEYYAVAGSDPEGAAITQTVRGSLEGSLQSVSCQLELEKSAFGSENVVTVVAKATTPYRKTLSARFGFDVQLEWSVESQNGALVLEIAGGSGENVTVAWPETVTPDRTNPLFAGASGNSVTFQAQSGVRYALTFFKADPEEEVSDSDFTVTTS